MLLPMVLNSISPSLKETYINELMKSSEELKRLGLTLTEEGAASIIEARSNALYSLGRVELGIEVTRKLIEYFSSSLFINDENFISIMNELHEIFYYFKNETEDRIADDKMIGIMRDRFENACGGSIELLKGTLEVFAADFRRGLMINDFPKEGDE